MLELTDFYLTKRFVSDWSGELRHDRRKDCWQRRVGKEWKDVKINHALACAAATVEVVWEEVKDGYKYVMEDEIRIRLFSRSTFQTMYTLGMWQMQANPSDNILCVPAKRGLGC